MSEYGMTTVGSQSRFSTIKALITDLLCRRSRRKVAVADATNVVPADVEEPPKQDSVDAGFCGEPFADSGELLSSLSPLLFSMKLFGLYFHREDRRRRRTDDPESNPATTTTPTSSTALRVYATVVLILMWLNAIRFVSVFTERDHFSADLLLKIMLLTWFCLVAIFQTAYYYASHTGKLRKILLTLPVTRTCVRSVRRAVTLLSAVGWIITVVNVAVGTYFYFDSNRYDFVLTPFATHIDVPQDNMTVARVIAYMLYMLLFPGVFFSHSMNRVLVYIFCSQFKKLKRSFRRALDERGQFTGDLSLFRRRHQTLSRAVRKVDGFVKFGNVAGFICHIANIVLLIYSLIFQPESRNDFISAVTTLFWLAVNVNGLLFSASAGIVVNHAVRMTCFIIHTLIFN